MRIISLILWVSLIIVLLQYLTEAQNVAFDKSDSILEARKNSNIMTGLTFRVPAFDYPPFFSIKRNSNGNYSYEGTASEMMVMIAQKFNYKISYVHVNRSEIEQTGMSTTIFRMLVDHEVDITSFPLERKMSYSERADLLFPFWVADFTLMQPWPEEESRLLIPIRPFSLTTWICVVGSMLTFICTSSTFLLLIMNKSTIVNAQKIPFLQIVFDQLEYIIAIITLQGYSHGKCSGTNRLSLRILVGSWLLAMVVLVYAYQGVLMSILSVPKLKPTVDTWEQLAQQHKYKLTIERSSTLTQLFMEAKSGTFKDIGDSLDPDLLFGDILKGVDNVLHHNCIYPGVMENIYYFISQDFNSNKKCRMTAPVKGLNYFMSYHIAVAKNSPYTQLLDHNFMLYFVETGLTIYMRKKDTPKDIPCRTDVKPMGKMSAFTFKDLTFALFLFCIGVGMSMILFLLELIIGHTSRIVMKNNQKHTRAIVVMPVYSARAV